MTDAASGLKAINTFIDESIVHYVDHIVPRDHALFSGVFEVARRFATDRTYVGLSI
jgi:predicted secreted protein